MKDIIINFPTEEGNFSIVHNSILNHSTLSDPAIRLLIAFLNNKASWKINLKYYTKLWSWSSTKMTNAVEDLMKNGFMKKHTKSDGKASGIAIWYTVSAKGDLGWSTNRRTKVNQPDNLPKEDVIAETKLQPAILEDITPSQEVLNKFDAILEAFNIDGLPSAQRKIHAKVKDVFTRRYKPFESDEELVNEIYRYYEEISPIIIAEESRQVKPRTTMKSYWE